MKVLTTGDVYCAAAAGTCYFESWQGVALAEHYQEQWDHQKAFVRELGGARMVSISYIVGVKLTPPSQEARKVLNDRATDMEKHMSAAAIVIPVGGVAPIIVRGVLATMKLLTRSEMPTEVFRDLDVACVWIAELAKPPLVASELYEAANTFLALTKRA